MENMNRMIAIFGVIAVVVFVGALILGRKDEVENKKKTQPKILKIGDKWQSGMPGDATALPTDAPPIAFYPAKAN